MKLNDANGTFLKNLGEKNKLPEEVSGEQTIYFLINIFFERLSQKKSQEVTKTTQRPCFEGQRWSFGDLSVIFR